MRSSSVVVIHREMLLGEGIASALRSYPGIAATGVATVAADARELGERADAVVLDAAFPGAQKIGTSLRRKGVRVVWLRQSRDTNGQGAQVSTRMPISALASAVAPHLRLIRRQERGLTARQRQILDLVSRGLAAKQVARQLGISAKTVENHKTRIFAKLGVPNQAAAVAQVMADTDRRYDSWSLSTT